MKKKNKAPTTLYICIYNEDLQSIEFAESYPIGTEDEQDWAMKNSQRLELECHLRRPEKWQNYYSTESQFAFEIDHKKD